MDKVAPLVLVIILCSCILPLSRAEPLPIDKLWVNGEDGVDNSTCGYEDAPCKTLQYTVEAIYRSGNISFVEITLQTDLLHEDFAIHAELSTVIIHIYGDENTIKASYISIPKVEYFHTWVDSSTLSGHTVTFTNCIITQSVVYGITEPEEAQEPELSLEGCHLTDTTTSFHNLNISDTLLINSPVSAPLDGSCDITHSNFTGTIGATALSCGSSNINTCVFNDNQGTFGGALNVIQFAYIFYSLIYNNSAEYGGGIYSQGLISLDNVEISGNQAQQGGGLYFYGAQTDMECPDTVLIRNNNAELGGGIAIVSDEFGSNTQGQGQLCVLRGNKASSEGGAIYVNSSGTSVSYFLVVDNLASVGAIYLANGSALNLTDVNVRGNIGGGVLSDDSAVVFISSTFFNNSDIYGSELDVRLQNSSSHITMWQHVAVSSEDAFLCDDCTGKFCSAGTSCADCGHGCMTLGTAAVCIESDFGCVHGTCERIKDQTPSCDCDNNYTGDLCEQRMLLPSQWENVIFIVLFGVGCVVTLALVVGFILRLHRHRAAYQPLLR